MQVVTIGDLKPAPALWHEDNGRKPWENLRKDPPGAISGKQLRDAAHRLVVNSLQMKQDRRRAEAPPGFYSDGGLVGISASPYQNGRYHNPSQGQPMGYSNQEQRYAPAASQIPPNHSYGWGYANTSLAYREPNWLTQPYQSSYENSGTPRGTYGGMAAQAVATSPYALPPGYGSYGAYGPTAAAPSQWGHYSGPPTRGPDPYQVNPSRGHANSHPAVNRHASQDRSGNRRPYGRH